MFRARRRARWEVSTEDALKLFLLAENPPEVAAVKGPYQANLGKFREALRGVAARKERLAASTRDLRRLAAEEPQTGGEPRRNARGFL